MTGWTIGIIGLIAVVTLGKIISLLKKKRRADSRAVSSAASRAARSGTASTAPAASSAASPSARRASAASPSAGRAAAASSAAANHSGSSAGSAVRTAQAGAGRGDTETGPMVYFANDKHGRKDREYRFNYKFVNGSWRAYILRTPSFERREQSGIVTHRLYDDDRPYVCWDTKLESLKDAQTVSKLWADCIQEYIATGKKFG